MYILHKYKVDNMKNIAYKIRCKNINSDNYINSNN